jgi:hypothetical protein
MPVPTAAGVTYGGGRLGWRHVGGGRHARDVAAHRSYLLAVLPLVNLIDAITSGSRANWLLVALIALALAFLVWQRRRREP